MRRNILATLLVCASLSAASCTGGQQGEAQAPTSPTPAASANAAANNNAAATAPASNSAPAQPQPVTASADEARLKAGGAGEAVVRLDIADGYHVNANPPSDRFYIGTELTVAPQEGLTPGKPSYPPPLNKKFKFAERPLAVYEGRAQIRLPLRADAAAARGQHTLRAKVRVQPCNDEACLPPRTVEVGIPVLID